MMSFLINFEVGEWGTMFESHIAANSDAGKNFYFSSIAISTKETWWLMTGNIS